MPDLELWTEILRTIWWFNVDYMRHKTCIDFGFVLNAWIRFISLNLTCCSMAVNQCQLWFEQLCWLKERSIFRIWRRRGIFIAQPLDDVLYGHAPVGTPAEFQEAQPSIPDDLASSMHMRLSSTHRFVALLPVVSRLSFLSTEIICWHLLYSISITKHRFFGALTSCYYQAHFYYQSRPSGGHLANFAYIPPRMIYFLSMQLWNLLLCVLCSFQFSMK